MLFGNAARHRANLFNGLRRKRDGRKDRTEQKRKQSARGAQFGNEILLRFCHDGDTLTQRLAFLHILSKILIKKTAFAGAGKLPLIGKGNKNKTVKVLTEGEWR
jgi:hypothetical protein